MKLSEMTIEQLMELLKKTQAKEKQIKEAIRKKQKES